MSAVNVDAEHFSQQGWVCVEDVVSVAVRPFKYDEHYQRNAEMFGAQAW